MIISIKFKCFLETLAMAIITDISESVLSTCFTICNEAIYFVSMVPYRTSFFVIIIPQIIIPVEMLTHGI